MKKWFYKAVWAILLQSALVHFSFGQGCSDPGFCTLNNFKPNGYDSTANTGNQLKTGAFYGIADHSIAVFGNYAEYNRRISDKLGIDVRFTTLAQTGNGISAFGLSDIFLNVNYTAMEKLKVTAGAKIPLSNSNAHKNNLPLPMDYQSSLGTLDLVVGVGYEIKKIQVVAAIQQPLTQNNNQFLSVQYPEDSPLRTFQSTNAYRRSGDVLLRFSYPVSVVPKLTMTPSLLPIYHLANDFYTDEFNNKTEIIGSEGLTLNGTVYLDYEINNKNIIQINMGTPFIARQARPDGLTRKFIVNLEYRIKF